MNYFRHEIITENVIRIIDCLDNCFYLVVGNEKACLLDTGDGFGNVKKYVNELTDKTVLVALTHGHLDHVGGSFYYDDIYLNPKDFNLFKSHNSADYRLRRYQDSKMAKTPISDFNPQYNGELKPIEDKMIFNLGGIRIQFFEVAGHTMGMMIPIILEERIAVFGDACGVGTLLFEEGSETVENYRKNLINFKKNEALYDTVLRNHGTFCSPKELLDNVIACCDDVLKGEYVREPVITHGTSFFIAKPIDEMGNRLDGIQGNLKFTKANI